MKSLPPGEARISPTEARIRLVDAASEARNTHFSHISCTICSLATEPKIPLPLHSAMGADTIRQSAVAFPEIQRLHWRELNDLAPVVERHGDRAQAAEYALASEFP